MADRRQRLTEPVADGVLDIADGMASIGIVTIVSWLVPGTALWLPNVMYGQ